MKRDFVSAKADDKDENQIHLMKNNKPSKAIYQTNHKMKSMKKNSVLSESTCWFDMMKSCCCSLIVTGK